MFLQAIPFDDEQALPVDAEATVEQAAQQAAAPVGSETTGGESVVALIQGLRARFKEWLETVRAHQERLSEAWGHISQRPRSAAGRDGIQGDPGVLCNGAQLGMEFLEATLPQQKQARSATEQERAAALFMELQLQTKQLLVELIAQRAEQTDGGTRASRPGSSDVAGRFPVEQDEAGAVVG